MHCTQCLRCLCVCRLDRERRGSFTFRLVALDGGGLSGSLRVTVDVIDVNDNNPRFDNASYNVAIPEDTPPGTTVIRVRATDPDSGPNGEIHYALRDAGHVFSVDQSGAVVLVSALDRESRGRYVLTATARNPVADALTIPVKIRVEVLDVNDNDPTIRINTLRDDADDVAQVNENRPPGTFVAHISAVDADAGDNGRVDCAVAERHFRIRRLFETEFKVVTTRRLDRETRDTYRLAVTCHDSGHVRRTTVRALTVRVIDDNDNTPVFDVELYAANVTEGDARDVTIAWVHATDVDEGANGNVSYVIDDHAAAYFSVDSDGRVATRGVLDREAHAQFDFRVTAVDAGSPRLTATTRIHVDVIDVDDNMPTFLKGDYAFGVTENQPADTSVGHVTAVDKDTTAHACFRYVIDCSNSSAGVPPAFRINATSGEIFTNAPLDRETLAMYRLTILAVPVGNITGAVNRTNIRIDIADTNDNAPVVKFPLAGTLAMWPKSPRDQPTSRIIARDSDAGTNARLNFAIVRSDDDDNPVLFNLDKTTGVLVYLGAASAAKGIEFGLTVNISDLGLPTLSTVTSFNVTVNEFSRIVSSAALSDDDDGAIAAADVGLAVSASVIVVIMAIAVGVIWFRRRRALERKATEDQFGKRVTAVRQADATSCLARKEDSVCVTTERDVSVTDVSAGRLCEGRLQDDVIGQGRRDTSVRLLLDALPYCSDQVSHLVILVRSTKQYWIGNVGHLFCVV